MDENDLLCSDEQRSEEEEIGKRGSEIKITPDEVLSRLHEQFCLDD